MDKAIDRYVTLLRQIIMLGSIDYTFTEYTILRSVSCITKNGTVVSEKERQLS